MLARNYDVTEAPMTPEERDRLTRTETILTTITERLEAMEGNIAKLTSMADRGAGAWYAILKIGSIITVIAAVFVWLFDKIQHVFQVLK